MPLLQGVQRKEKTVPEEVAEMFKEFDRKEAAYRLRTYRHKAYYSLAVSYTHLDVYKRQILLHSSPVCPLIS